MSSLNEIPFNFFCFQCYDQECMNIRPMLTLSDREKFNYCRHLKKVQIAKDTNAYAEEIQISKDKIISLNLDKIYLDMLSKVENQDGSITVYNLPNKYIAVPSLFDKSHENPLKFVHIQNFKCTLSKCQETKSKVRTLSKKDDPLCLHALLARCSSNVLQEDKNLEIEKDDEDTEEHELKTKGQLVRLENNKIVSNGISFKMTSNHLLFNFFLDFMIPPTISSFKLYNRKADRLRTIQNVLKRIRKEIPTLSQSNDDFLVKNKKFNDSLIDCENISELFNSEVPNQCDYCLNVNLKVWPYAAKKTYYVSFGLLKTIDLKVKICTSCSVIYYPNLYDYGIVPMHNRFLIRKAFSV